MKLASAPAGFTLRAALVAALFLLAASCGGGSSFAPATGLLVPVTPRAGLHMTYFQDCGPMMLEHVDHIDAWWTRGDCGTSTWSVNIAQELQTARGTNIQHIVLSLPAITDIPALRAELTYLVDVGALRGWKSITLTIDEPETAQGGSLTDQQVRDRMTAVKRVALDVGLGAAHYGVSYQCASGKRPGISAFDRVGCFRYESTGCQLLETDYALLRAQLAPGAMLWMFPGGATIGGKNGRQDPACWASYAHRFLDVWGIVAFLYQSVRDGGGGIELIGIRDNGMLTLYCETGRVILNPTASAKC